MLRGYVRGNPVTWDGKRWRLADGRDAAACPLTCSECRAVHQPGEPDACLGLIPGAAGACCGHGVHVGYVNWPGIAAPPGWRFNGWVGETPCDS